MRWVNGWLREGAGPAVSRCSALVREKEASRAAMPGLVTAIDVAGRRHVYAYNRARSRRPSPSAGNAASRASRLKSVTTSWCGWRGTTISPPESAAGIWRSRSRTRRFTVTDRSRAGTLKNGRQLPAGQPVPLVHGDKLVIAGVIVLVVEFDERPRVVPAVGEVSVPVTSSGSFGRVLLEATVGDMVTIGATCRVSFSSRNRDVATDTTLGPYVLERELGRGAFGVVYQGHHEDRPDTRLAIKTVDGQGNVDHLLAEPALLARLKHPCVVGLEDYFVHDGKLVLALEFVPGDDLKAYLDRGDQFAPEQVATC